MISIAQEKLIKSLQRKQGREKHRLCLVEGSKLLDLASEYIDFTFKREDTDIFDHLVTTKTPQHIAAVARIPKWSLEDVAKERVVVLDGVQDPGNVGAIMRLCLGFDAGLVLVESADVSSPKVVRSSVGTLFQIPWIAVKRADMESTLNSFKKPIYRLENSENAKEISEINESNFVLVVGSEGSGIKSNVEGQSINITHSKKLESLNVANALAIALYTLTK